MVRTTLKARSIGRVGRPKSKGKGKLVRMEKGAATARLNSAAMPLRQPLTSFAIPLVHAEIVMDDSLKNNNNKITYGEPQETEFIRVENRESYKMCRIPVFEGGKKRGFVPLPLRYRDVWLELSYNIVLCTNIWELWLEEGKKKSKGKKASMVATCRKNTGSMLVQHMLTRRLVVEQLLKLDYLTEPGKESVPLLDEWKIRMCRDWWNKSYDEAFAEGREFLSADPVTAANKAFFEKGWDIDEKGKESLLSPPDPAAWINGRVEGIHKIFAQVIMPQALNELKKPGAFHETRHLEGGELPGRWHERHDPCPYFWSEAQWEWYSEGHNFSDTPIAFFNFVLRKEPSYANVKEFEHDVKSIANIIFANSERNGCENIQEIVGGLWLGEMTWREFVDYLRQKWHLNDDSCKPWEKKDEKNPFNSLEAQLIFQGFVRRGSEKRDWNPKDQILWESLLRMSPKEYEPVWKRVVKTILEEESSVGDVLKDAGNWSHHSKSVEDSETGQVENQAQPQVCLEQVDRADASANFNQSPPKTSEKQSTLSHQLLPIYEWMLAYVQKTISLETFEEKLRSSLSNEHEKGIQQFLDDIRAIPPGNDVASKDALDSFVNRVKALEARREAGRLHNNLL
ncbi:uncharacterized protein F5891DRAFT_1195209 [Suillus fuscotomentosus]|uniref:Uncharacterized protein n=1 Tax=Suillus fuscotomentosus TaxID=1912939 RepID=A0AAD4HEC8_9AGAM|nr:uncharacterized protein F5891DRAFT_1195209 [Suillus fuscotomentosus]KAG1894510.1 hypothetical protein F5891DRAFT_1195209 [Suillus fuscotomentosus]